jgi:hypothetical protein
MKTIQVIPLAVCVLALIAVLPTKMNSASTPPPLPNRPQVWEYKVVDLPVGGYRPDTVKAIQAVVNDLAKDGWELVSAGSDAIGYFKRAK